MSEKDNFYTYVVNHGDKSPRVGGADTYNGDPVFGVAFTNMIANNQKAQDLLQELQEQVNDVDRWSVDEFQEKANKLIDQIEQLI